jgi:hypothetical protein
MNTTQIDTSDVTKAFRAVLRERTGLAWNVRAGRGSCAGGVQIESPASRRDPANLASMSRADAAALAKAFGIPESHCFHGVVQMPVSMSRRV